MTIILPAYLFEEFN